MSARRCAAVEQAMKLVLEEGRTEYDAARAMGIWPSTLYRALFPNGKKKQKKVLAKRIA